jgi:RNA polymerase sigma-70 factor (ECF subfamily)
VVADLPAGQREAVRMLHIDELTLKEASVESSKSTGSLKVAGHRALKALKRALHGGDHPHD